MGYTTDFKGSFKVEPQLKENHHKFLIQFAESRRMKRDVDKLDAHINSGLGIGPGRDGGYFVHNEGRCGPEGPGILDYNTPPAGQPGLWCQWIPNDNGTAIEWDGGEKFYHYVEWIEYLIEHFLAPWGYTLNGTVKWKGEDSGDYGKIVIKDNVVEVLQGKESYVKVKK